MKLRLQAKLTVIFLCIFIITFGLMGIIAYQGSKESLKECVLKQQHCRRKGIEGRLDSFCNERQREIRSKATSIYIRGRLGRIEEGQASDLLVGEIIMRLNQMIEGDSSALELFIVDIGGKVIASTDETQIGLDKSDRNYFSKGCGFITGITDIYYSPVFKQPTMLAFTPIIQLETGKLLGVGVERVNFKYLSKTITKECALLEEEKIFLLDKKGRFVCGSIASEVPFGKKFFSDSMKDYSSGNCESISRYKDYKGRIVIGNCNWLADKQCMLVVEISEKEAFKSIYKIRNWFFAVGFIVTLLIAVLITMVARHLALPVIRLREAADKVAGGDLKIEVEVKTGDEIEALANSFNRMTKDLKNSRWKLEEWGRTLEQKIREKTSELQEKVEELEKFNKVAVDRELKMIALKEEIESLKKKLEGG